MLLANDPLWNIAHKKLFSMLFTLAPYHNAEKQEWELKSSSRRNRHFLRQPPVSISSRGCVSFHSWSACNLNPSSLPLLDFALCSIPLFTSKVRLNNRAHYFALQLMHADTLHTLSVCADADKKELVLVSAHIATFMLIQRSVSCASELQIGKK
jgi:hypothetical protein